MSADITYYIVEGERTVWWPSYARSYIGGEWRIIDVDANEVSHGR